MAAVDADVISDVPSKALAIRGPRRYDLVVTAIRDHQPAARHYSLAVLRFCLRTFPLDCLRGFAMWVRGWWRWMLLATATERAIAEGKASIGEDKRIAERKLRVMQSLIGGFFLAVAGALFWWLAPPLYHHVAILVVVLGWFATGHQWRRPGDATPDERPPGWDGTLEAVRRALVAAGVLKKGTKTTAGQGVWMEALPERVGVGTQLTIGLEPGVTWRHVLAKAEAVGSGLACDSDFMVVEKGDHDGQAKMWVPDHDPYAGRLPRFPLLDTDQWNSWEPAPFAVTPHGQVLDMSLIGSNYLGGGKPGSGKSFSARPVVAPFILDPTCRMFVFNGKGDAAWEPIRDLSVKYVRGARPEHVWEFHATLTTILEEMERRYDASTTSKVEEGGELAPWLLIADEVQEYLSSDIDTEFTARGKKKAPMGKVLDEMLTRLARLGRAAGIIVVMLSQRPDDTVMSLALRSMFGTRFCNRTMSAGTGEIILGVRPGPGTDASKVPTKYKGLGILVPDGEKVRIEGTPLCRPFFVSDDDWADLGKRGYQLRRDAGTAGYLRRTAADALPLPDLMAAILEDVADRHDDERVASRDLREALAPDMNDTVFGRQLRNWGCPSGRDSGNQGPRGPLVGDLRAAAQRIREGGPAEILKSA